MRPELRAAVGSLSKGDVVTAEYDRDKDTDVLRAVSVKAESVGPGRRALAMALNAAGLVLTSWLLLRSGLPDLIVGADNRYSKSKFQMVVWFAALLVSFITLTALRMSTLEHGMDFVGGVGIPQNLLLLSGLSAATFAVAKGITQGRVEAATRPPPAGTPTTTVAQAGTGATLSIPAATEPGIVQKIAGADRPSLRRDLFRDDAGRVDVGDYQLVILTMLAVVVYLLTVFNFLGSIEYRHAVVLPDVDGAILAAVGVGHGAYLAKKLVGEAGGGKSVAT